ncbi:MFS general substrate transporter, partial [Periconia macrospinosa]
MMVRTVMEEEEVRLLQPKDSEKSETSTNTQSLPPKREKREETKTTWRHLPEKKQLLLLAFCRLSTPLSNACLLPYIYPLVSSILTTSNSTSDKPTAQQITRLTGLIIAAYPLGQTTTSLLWTHLSALYGRKPIILISLLLSIVANIGFAFSTSIATLLFWRVLAGMANGVVGVMRTMTTEIVREKKWNARAFLAMPVVFNSGRVAGVVLGGVLADVGGKLGWKKWPYALPAVFNAGILAVCLGAAIFGLRESLEERRNRKDWGVEIGRRIYSFARAMVFGKPAESGYVEVNNQDHTENEKEDRTQEEGILTTSNSPANPPLRSIFTPDLIKVLISFTLFHLHNTTFLHIYPVYLSMPTQPSSSSTSSNIFHTTSGLGLSPSKIGLALGLIGLLGILLQLFIYPQLQSKLGTQGVLRLANTIFPLAYVLAPFLSLLASANPSAKYPAIAGLLFLQVMGRTMAMPSNMVLLTEAARERKAVGTVQGWGTMLGCFAGAIGP